MEQQEEEESAGSRRHIATVLSGTVSGREAKKKKVALLPSGQMHKKHMAKPLRLTEITRPLPSEELQRSLTAALDRLLGAEQTARLGGLVPVRAKLLAMMSAHFTPQLMDSG